jgi:hypothetical protein
MSRSAAHQRLATEILGPHNGNRVTTITKPSHKGPNTSVATETAPSRKRKRSVEEDEDEDKSSEDGRHEAKSYVLSKFFDD